MDKAAREQAKGCFLSHYREFRDYRAAARAAGVSERTGRRWRNELSSLSGLDSVPTPIEPELTSFVGREAELQGLSGAFEAGTRLLTLVGPPGIGKTRLAMRFLRGRTGAGETTLFCDLREAETLQGTVEALGQTLGMRMGQGRAPSEQAVAIGRALEARGPCLLGLDNFEQLVGVAPETILTWLRMAPKLRVLVTSRRILRLTGERIYELGPMSIPLPDGGEDGDEPWANDTMRLFYERAKAVQPRFEADRQRADVVRRLVRRLEGIPLAIELAAGQMGRVGPGELLERLEANLLHLRDRTRGGDPRHTTLRAAIEGSWQLLSPMERDALQQLSVFRGGFTMASAEAVLDLDDDRAPSSESIVASLRETSLLRTTESVDPSYRLRFDMYASIREFASEKLHDSEAEAEVRRRHAAHYLVEGEQLASALRTRSGPKASKILARELDNLRAAFRWLERAESGSSDDAVLRMALVLHAGLRLSVPSAAVEILGRALRRVVASDDSERTARALLARAEVCRATGDYAQAGDDLERLSARGLTTELSGELLFERAMVVFKQGDPRTARALLEESCAKAIACNATHLEGRVRTSLGWVLAEAFGDESAGDQLALAVERLHEAGDVYAEATARLFEVIFQVHFLRGVERQEFDRRITEAIVLGDQWLLANAHIGLGFFLQDGGDLDGATKSYDQAVVIAARSGLRYTEAAATNMLATVFHERGDLDRAVLNYVVATEIFREIHGPRVEGIITVLRAGALASRGNVTRARELVDWGASLIARGGDTSFACVAEVQRGIVELAEARIALAEGRLGRAKTLRLRAMRRARAAETGGRNRRSGGKAHSLAGVSTVGRIVLRLFRAELRRRPAVEIRRDGRAFRVDEQNVVELSDRPVARRVLAALVRTREADPGRALSRDELLEHGWPGEKVVPRARSTRVRNVVLRLRQAGLQGVLVTSERGYLLDPNAPIAVSPTLSQRSDLIER